MNVIYTYTMNRCDEMSSLFSVVCIATRNTRQAAWSTDALLQLMNCPNADLRRLISHARHKPDKTTSSYRQFQQL